MALRSIHDWDEILKPSKPTKNKAVNPVKKLDRPEASQAALKGDHWHDNMLRMVGSWVAKGNNDEEIHVLAAKHTLPEYTAEQTQQEIQKMIDGAKAKGFAPARSFEELLDAIETISQDDIEGIEAIIEESRFLPSIKLETVQRALKTATGYTLGAIRKHRSELFAANPEPDQLDLAKKTISVVGRDNILHAQDQTWVWNQSGVWGNCLDRKIKQIAQRVIDSEEIDISAGLVNGVSDVLKSEINSADHLFNLGNPETVNCLNGQLELEDGIFQLRPHKREEYRTTQIPISYDPRASAKRFQKFLAEIFESDQDAHEKGECLLQMIGYTMMSHSRHEKFIMLIGNGANGKSVLLAIIEALCGSSNVAGVQPSKFESSFQRAHLHNKLANIVTELSEGEKLADAELKSITSGEPVTVEHKYQHPFNMRPYSTCWFGTNHMPPTSDFSEALFRRAVIVTFNRTFQSHEQNPNLKDDLENELSGILNLALAAYAGALKNGFTIPASSQPARDEWKLETNQVAQFVIDKCDERPEAAESFNELYRCYQGWVHRNHLTSLTPKTFSSRMQRLGFISGKSGPIRKFKGLQLKR
jgi:putative DNA primase/helicase